MMSGRQWGILAKYTLYFIAVANEYGFCTDLIGLIRRRLFNESPFKIHHREKGAKKNDKNC